MRSLLRKFWKDQRGGPAIEFALVISFLGLVIPAVADLATMVHSAMKLSGGMRAGEQYALKYPSDTSGITQAVAQASNLPAGDITTNASQFCECNGTGASCSASCSYGIARYSQISVSYDLSDKYLYSNMTLYPQTLTKQITIRVQ